MALIKINWNPSQRDLRQFGAIWLPGFLVIVGAMLWYRGTSFSIVATLWTIAAVACLVALTFPNAMRPVYIALTCATFPIGWVVSHLLLAFIFYLIITPIGLVMRLCGYDPMHRKFDRGASTYWKPHATETDTSRYFRQF